MDEMEKDELKKDELKTSEAPENASHEKHSETTMTAPRPSIPTTVRNWPPSFGERSPPRR